MAPFRSVRILARRAALFQALWRARAANAVRPVVANLFLTAACDGKCRYCYTDKSIPGEKELSTARWKELMDELVGRGCRMVNLMGGEPLMSPKFEEILEYAFSRGVVVDVNTNAMRLPAQISAVKKATQVFTSLDGDRRAHDANRGEGSFEKTVEGIRAARKAGIPVRINCTVTSANANEDSLKFLLSFCREQNLFLTFTPLIRVREALWDKAKGLDPGDATTRAFFARIRKAAKTHPRIMNSRASLDFLIHYPTSLGVIVKRDAPPPLADYYSSPCPYGRLQHFFAPDGNVFPCHNLWNDPDFRPKNILQDGLIASVENASKLSCKYCWLANLVEWNEFISPRWLLKGAAMTLRQLF